MDTVLSNVDKFKDAANVLYVYGPFALILVFIFIAEWRIRPSMKDSTGQVAKVAVGTYIVVWLLVLGFAITCVFAWYKLNIHNESVVKGTFENVNGLETVTSDHPSLWLQRTYGGHDGSYNYSWQLISEKPLLQGQIVDFYLNRPGKKDGNPEGLKISLNVRTEFYKVQPVKLQFDRRSDSVFLVLNQKREPVALEPLAAVKGSMGSNE